MTIPTPVRLILVALLGLFTALLLAGCRNECATGAVCGDYNVIGPSGTPTPTPVPSPGSTPDPCDPREVGAVIVSFHSGVQMPFLALGETHQLDATPVNRSGLEIPAGCNVARPVTWTVLTQSTCQIIGSGFNPFLRGLRVGTCSLTATVAGVPSALFSVEVR